MCNEKEHDFEFKTARCHRMNSFGKAPRDQAVCRLNHFAVEFTQVGFPGWNGSLRVLFAERAQGNPHTGQIVFDAVHGKRFITHNPCTSREIKLVPVQRARIVVRARQQKELDRLTRCRDHQRHAQAIEIAAFTGNVTTVIFTL